MSKSPLVKTIGIPARAHRTEPHHRVRPGTMASRSDPGPLSFTLVTVRVAACTPGLRWSPSRKPQKGFPHAGLFSLLAPGDSAAWVGQECRRSGTNPLILASGASIGQCPSGVARHDSCPVTGPALRVRQVDAKRAAAVKAGGSRQPQLALEGRRFSAEFSGVQSPAPSLWGKVRPPLPSRKCFAGQGVTLISGVASS